MIAIVALLAGGCVLPSVQRYDDVRGACELGDGEYVPLPYGYEGAYRSVSARCSEALGHEFAVDWGSFEDEPGEVVGAGSASDMVVASAYVFVAADLGTLAEMDEALTATETLRGVLDDWLVASEVPPTEPAGVFWLDWFAHEVASVQADELDGYGGMYLDSGTLTVDAEAPPDGASGILEHPVGRASTFVREVATKRCHEHVPCDDGGTGCDPDLDGALGASARFLERWMDTNAGLAGSQECDVVRFWSRLACSAVNEVPEGGSVCEVVAAKTCE